MRKLIPFFVILLLTGLILWLHHETVLKGIIPEYGIKEPYEFEQEEKTCKPAFNQKLQSLEE